MDDDPGGEGYASAVGTGMLEGANRLMEDGGKAMLKDAGKTTRYVLRQIPGVPGFIYDAADIATAADRKRAVAGAVGGAIGGLLGEVGGPVAGAVGASAGDAGAKWLYDHRTPIADWMKQRADQVAAGAGRALDAFTLGLDHGPPAYPAPRTY